MDSPSGDPRVLASEIVGPLRVVAFGASSVAPAGAVVAGLLIVVSYAGYASPLVVVIAFAASLCCASGIGQFARRLPSAGSLYTYNSRGLGPVGGFLTGWMMIFAYAVYVPAGICVTSAYLAQLLLDTVDVRIDAWVLYPVILFAVAVIAYLGIATSSSVDLVLVLAEVAVFTALAITILPKVGPTNFSLDVFAPSSSPNGRLGDIATGMIYGITAFAGYEAVAALGEEAKNSRRSIPRSILGVVVVVGAFYLLVVAAEMWGVGKDGIPQFAQRSSPMGYLASEYWSPSVLWAIDLVIVLTGLGFVIASLNAAIRILYAMGRERTLSASLARLSGRRTPVVAIGCVAAIALLLGLPLTVGYGGLRAFGFLAGAGGLSIVLLYLAVNIAVIRVFRTEFRSQFVLWRHLLVPATAAVLLLFPLWGVFHPRGSALADRLPFAALGWLCLGAIGALFLRRRRPASFAALGRVFVPVER
jgi:amino acid transporter